MYFPRSQHLELHSSDSTSSPLIKSHEQKAAWNLMERHRKPSPDSPALSVNSEWSSALQWGSSNDNIHSASNAGRLGLGSICSAVIWSIRLLCETKGHLLALSLCHPMRIYRTLPQSHLFMFIMSNKSFLQTEVVAMERHHCRTCAPTVLPPTCVSILAHAEKPFAGRNIKRMTHSEYAQASPKFRLNPGLSH